MPKTKDLDAKSSAYRGKIACWDSLDLLSCGGYALLSGANRFLAQRPREGADVYGERIANATYNNVIGSVAGWYQSALLKNNPALMVMKDGAAVEDAGWWGLFEKNVDRGGASLAAFGADLLRDFIVYGEAWVQVDLPKVERQYASKAEQDADGALSAFLTRYDPRQVIDWSEDSAGRLEWVKIKATVERREFLKPSETVDLWYYFDRTDYRIFEAVRKEGKPPEEALEIANGRHALADVGEVPVRHFRVAEELWLGNRVLPQLMEHFRTENGLGWSIENACYPVPYIKGEFSDAPTPSVVTFLRLAPDGEFGYAETSGLSFEAAAKRCASIREDIYRGCYLQAQGRSSEATPAAQSGYSKELDMAPSVDVLGRFGQAVRDALESILVTVSVIRGEDVSFALSGYEFDDAGADAALDRLERVQRVGIESDTLRRVLAKRAARALLIGEDPAIVQQAEGEIEAAPTLEEKAAAEVEARKTAMRGAFGSQK